MSERRQRGARDRRDAALQREANALARARHQRELGDPWLAELHETAAAAQHRAAEAAEALRVADVAIEGDRLDGPAELAQPKRPET